MQQGQMRNSSPYSPYKFIEPSQDEDFPCHINELKTTNDFDKQNESELQGSSEEEPEINQKRQSQKILFEPPQQQIQQSPQQQQPYQQQYMNMFTQIQQPQSQQKNNEQEMMEKYFQIIQFYESNLKNLQTLVLQKEQNLQVKQSKINQLELREQELQDHIVILKKKYEQGTEEIMSFYQNLSEECRQLKLQLKQQPKQQNEDLIREILTLKESLVDSNALKNQLELAVAELQSLLYQNTQVIASLKTENQFLKNRLDSAVEQNIQKNSQTIENQQILSANKSQAQIRAFNDRLSYVKSANQAETQRFDQEVHDLMISSYYKGTQDKSKQNGDSFENINQLTARLQYLTNQKQQIENDLMKFPQHVRNLAERKRKQQIEEALSRIENDIETLKIQIKRIRN